MTARHDPLHIPWAFSLEQAPSLPLTGEAHPLRRELARWLTWANVIVLALGLIAYAAWFFWSRVQPKEPEMRRVHIVRYTELGVPPSISRPSVPQVAIAQAIAPPSIGIPEPVKDELAPAQTIATQTEMKEALEPLTASDLGTGTGDSLVVDVDVDTSPSPDEFVAVDEEPVRLHIDPPVYPDVARSAGIEGTVLVRVLVGKDGKVKDVIVIDTIPMLEKSAIACAKTATFKPAVSQGKPVEVWVMMPVTFKLF